MKFKKLLAAVVATAAITGVAAAAEEIDRNFFIEYAYTNGFKVEKIGDTDKSANVLFLNYDDNGRLTSVDTTVISDFSKNYTYEEVGIDASHLNENTKIVIPGESSQYLWKALPYNMPENPDLLFTAQIDDIKITEDNTIIEFPFSYDEYEPIIIPNDAEVKVYIDEGEMQLSELQEMDVVSVEYDLEAGLGNSDYYNIYVSRWCMESNIKNVYTDEDKTIVEWREGLVTTVTYNGRNELLYNNSFTGYFDIFGRIVQLGTLGGDSDSNAIGTNVKGVLENLYKGEDDRYYASVITWEGKLETYPLADKEKPEKFEEVLYADDSSRNFVAERFIGYSLNSKDEIRLHGKVDMEYITDARYNAENKLLGDVYIDDYRPQQKEYDWYKDCVLDLTDYYENDSYNEIGVRNKSPRETGKYSFISDDELSEKLSEDKTYTFYVFDKKYKKYVFIMQD